MIPGNGIIPRYHQSGFIREQNISQKKDKNFNHWKWGPGMEIITVEMFDGVHDEEEEDWERRWSISEQTKAAGIPQYW